MIELKNVSFRYTDDDIILKDTSLKIHKGKITVILGKNGVGKTTLLSLINGFLSQDTGNIKLEEESMFIYDNPFLYEYLTGEEYLELIKNIGNRKIIENIDGLIKDLELTQSMNKLISAYSLGMKHKLALLTALSLNYNLYLIDEPLASLDPESQNIMVSFFKKMREDNKTLVISTHMLYVAFELADEIVIFKDKKLEKYENEFSSYTLFEEFVIKSLKVEV